MDQNQEPKTTINLITPPDKLYNLHTSFLLLYPSESVKFQFQNLIENARGIFNVYLYDQEEPVYEWLLSVLKISDYVIVDVDNVPPNHRDLLSYIIAHSNAFWLTKAENELYTKLSSNRIYNLDWLQSKIIGGNVETQSQQ